MTITFTLLRGLGILIGFAGLVAGLNILAGTIGVPAPYDILVAGFAGAVIIDILRR